MVTVSGLTTLLLYSWGFSPYRGLCVLQICIWELSFFQGGEWHAMGRSQGKGEVEGKNKMGTTITTLRLKAPNSRKHVCIFAS